MDYTVYAASGNNCFSTAYGSHIAFCCSTQLTIAYTTYYCRLNLLLQTQLQHTVYTRLMEAIGLPEKGAANPEYASNSKRCERADEIMGKYGECEGEVCNSLRPDTSSLSSQNTLIFCLSFSPRVPNSSLPLKNSCKPQVYTCTRSIHRRD